MPWWCMCGAGHFERKPGLYFCAMCTGLTVDRSEQLFADDPKFDIRLHVHIIWTRKSLLANIHPLTLSYQAYHHVYRSSATSCTASILVVCFRFYD
jgi:hypothetical protein